MRVRSSILKARRGMGRFSRGLGSHAALRLHRLAGTKKNGFSGAKALEHAAATAAAEEKHVEAKDEEDDRAGGTISSFLATVLGR